MSMWLDPREVRVSAAAWLFGLVCLACGPTADSVDIDALELAVWGGQEGVSAYSVDGTEHRRLGPSQFYTPPVWTPDGARVLFEGDDLNVVIHDLAANETVPITDDPRRLDAPVLSPDGDHVAVSFGDWGPGGRAKTHGSSWPRPVPAWTG